MRPPVPLTAALPVAVVAGVAAWLSFPATGWWWAAPLAVCLLVVATAGRTVASGLLVGLAFGLAFEVPLLSWTGIYLGWLPWTALAVLQALFLALAGAGLALVSRLPGGPVVRAVLAAAVWVAVEALQARQPFGGFGWSRLAFSQTDAPTLSLAWLAGAPAVSVAVAVTGALVAHAGLAVVGRAGRPGTPRDRRPVAAAVAVLLAGGVLASGLLVPLDTAAERGTLAVAGVQGDVAEPGLEFNAERRAVLDNHADGTHALADRVAAGESVAPDVVVWPENASDLDPFRNPDAARVISSAVDDVDATTLVGTLVLAPDERIRNTTLVWEPGTGPAEGAENRYEKRHPVPFAEYVPYRDFFRRITPLVDLAGNMAPGTRVGLLEVPVPGRDDVPLGDLICFEVVEDGLVADVVDAGAQLVVVQTNNATFGDSDESVQQLAMSRLRAVEHGRAVAHVSTVGVSAMIAPDGSLETSSELLTADVLEAELPLRDSLTPASRVRAWPEAALAGLGVLGALAGLVVGRRRTPTPDEVAA